MNHKTKKIGIEIDVLNNVTKKDFIEATSKMLEKEHIEKLIEKIPIFVMVIPLITAELWDILIEIKKGENNESAES